MKKLLGVLLVLSLLLATSLSAAFATEVEVHESGDYKYIVLGDGTAEITGYSGKADKLTIPGELDGYRITSIGDYAFSMCDFLVAVIIPDGVTRIGDGVFVGCSAFSSATIPDSVTSIGDDAFKGLGLVGVTVGRNSYADMYCEQHGLIQGYIMTDNEPVKVQDAPVNSEAVPVELQGTWIVKKMFGKDDSIDISSAIEFGARVEMILKPDERFFSVSFFGMESEATREKLVLLKDGLLFSPETSRYIAWHFNSDASVMTMTDSGETYILAIRPETDLTKAKIPSYPSIPSENDLVAENASEEEPSMSEKASLTPEMIALSKEMDDVFAKGGTVKLVQEEFLTAEQQADLQIVDLSPDGKTILCKKQDEDNKWQLCLVRDGNVIPVKLNSEKGVGDLYGTFEFYKKHLLKELPGREGVSWSADGHYVTFSNIYDTFNEFDIYPSSAVPVLDTEDGELWLADAFLSGEINKGEQGFGVVYLCRFSRNDGYIYYYTKEIENNREVSHLCRCKPDGSNKKILSTVVLDRDRIFDLTETSEMIENTDGSWLILGVNKWDTRIESNASISIARFFKSYIDWDLEVFPTGVHYPSLNADKFDFSSLGYGILLLNMKRVNICSRDSLPSSDGGRLTSYYARRIKLVRVQVLPGAKIHYSIWGMQNEGDNNSSAKVLMSSDGHLHMMKLAMQDIKIYLPDGFDSYKPSDDPLIKAVCISPDGQYAILSAISEEKDGWYLAKLDSMDLLPIDVPEDIPHKFLASGRTAFREYFPRQMDWQDDGTVLVVRRNDNTLVKLHFEIVPEVDTRTDEEKRIDELKADIERQKGKVEAAETQLQRWIDGGKKTEEDIEKQRKKVEEQKAKLTLLEEELAELEGDSQ